MPRIIQASEYATPYDQETSLGAVLARSFGNLSKQMDERRLKQIEEDERKANAEAKKLQMETLQHQLKGMKLATKMDLFEQSTKAAQDAGQRAMEQAPPGLLEAALAERVSPPEVGPPAEAGLDRPPQVQIPGVEEFGIQPRMADPLAEAMGRRVSGEREALQAFLRKVTETQEMEKAKAAGKAEGEGRQLEKTVDLGDRTEYIYSDGTSEFKAKGAAPARAGSDSKLAQLFGTEDLPSGEEFLAMVPAADRALVKKIANYEADPAKIAGLRNDRRTALISMALQYDPNYAPSDAGARAKVVQDFKSGQSARNLTSINTVVSHIADLRKAAKELNNWSKIPSVANRIRLHGEKFLTGSPAMAGFKTAADAVVTETTRAFLGGVPPVTEIKEWRENIPLFGSPEEQQKSLDTILKLLAGRVGALKDQYERGMGKPMDFKFLSKEARKTLESLGYSMEGLDDEPAEAEVDRAQSPEEEALFQDMKRR